MSYPEGPGHRVEEGVAVFSKYPIVESEYLMMSRELDNEDDAHQRICLRVAVNTPNNGVVNFFVSHLALQ